MSAANEGPSTNTDASSTLHTVFDRLHKSFHGALLDPTSTGYDQARAVHNGMIDKRPAFIAQCANVNDVIMAIDMARSLNLELSIRGGGHNVGGRAVTNGGVMIDLSSMNNVTVNANARTVTAEGGATWAAVNAATAKHGLGTTGGVISSTGVGGLTLGGGLGWLMALHGLAVDNLLSATIVTADGEIVTASADQNEELFWALRGGGGNFGVATSFTFRLHPISDVIGGLVVHPVDKAGETLRFYRGVSMESPDELSLFAGLLHAADGSGNKVCAMVGFHPDQTAGAALLAPVRAFGPPAADMFGPMPYEQLNLMLDGGFPKGALNYWKSAFIDKLTDDAIDTMVAAYAKCPTSMSVMLLEHFHGAVTRVPADATAFPHRSKGYNLLIAAQWMDPAQTNACTTWAQETYKAMMPFMTGGRYVNYLGDDENTDAVAGAFGANYARLQAVKAKYDPTNLFRLNQNIRGSATA